MNYKMQRNVDLKTGNATIEINLWNMTEVQIKKFNELSEIISNEVIKIQDIREARK